MEGLGTVLILFIMGWASWKLVFSRLPAIRAMLKKFQLEEVQDIAKTAREFNPEQAKKDEEAAKEFLK